jgi:hypothetical protein
MQNVIGWKRVTRGVPVRDHRLRSIETAKDGLFGWQAESMARFKSAMVLAPAQENR